MLSCSIWFFAPSFYMDGGLESRSVGRVYGADGAVQSLGTIRSHVTSRGEKWVARDIGLFIINYKHIFIHSYFLTNVICIPSLQGTLLPQYLHIFPHVCGPGSSVSIATDYGLDGPGSNPGGDEIFCPPYRPWGPPSLQYNVYRVFPWG